MRHLRFARTGREADTVARACPVESYTPRRSRTRWLIALAVTGATAIVEVERIDEARS